MADYERRTAPDAGAPCAIHCQDVTKSFRRHVALDNVAFTIDQGQSVALLGPNGAGKTSLLRVILDFSRADEGAVSLLGLDSRNPQARRALAFLPERFSPNPEMTGQEVLSLFARLRGERYADADRDEILERLQFPREAVARSVRGYSKGMLQKLGLAAVVLARAPITVLDEPMSGLDPVTRITMREVMRGLRSHGRTLLFTTHSLHDLDLLCDHVLVLKAGRLVFNGSPEAMREQTGQADIEAAFMATVQDAPAMSP